MPIPPAISRCLPALVQREQVAWATDFEFVVLAYSLVQKTGAAARGFLEPDADLVAAGVIEHAGQRIGVAVAAVVHVDNDVAAALEGGQRVAVARLQGETLDAGGKLLDAADAHAESVVHCGTSGMHVGEGRTGLVPVLIDGGRRAGVS